MDNADISRKCSEFLQSLGIPGVIVFGWQKDDGQFGFVYSRHKIPTAVAIKGMAWAIQDLAGKK